MHDFFTCHILSACFCVYILFAMLCRIVMASMCVIRLQDLYVVAGIESRIYTGGFCFDAKTSPRFTNFKNHLILATGYSRRRKRCGYFSAVFGRRTATLCPAILCPIAV